MMKNIFSGISRTPATSEIGLFLSLVNGFELLINVLKKSIYVVDVLDTPYFVKLQIASL